MTVAVIGTYVDTPSSEMPTGLVCAGCGYRVPSGEIALRCPAARPGDDIDHVIARELRTDLVGWPTGGESNPFVRYRTLFHWYHLARGRGLTDADIVGEIDRLDAAVAEVDGHGFTITPFSWQPRLLAWVKDETGNVSGSHKARHLFGTLLALRLAGADDGRPLAIASCGNAALGAAVVARAADRALLVFVPTDADTTVVARLESLGAQVNVCERAPGESGDPTVHRMREAVAAGALPFTCQGNENGLAIEAGLTLGYELADALRDEGARTDHIVIQVGGGALASSVIQGLAEARALGAIDALPRVHAVETRGVAPLARAYRVLRDDLDAGGTLDDVLAGASRRRSRYMQPWSPVRPSIATGILDDETYDWLAVARGMLTSGGRPVLVDEAALAEANKLARDATGINVDPTGSAGLAGLLQLRRSGDIQAIQACVVLFTGARRS